MFKTLDFGVIFREIQWFIIWMIHRKPLTAALGILKREVVEKPDNEQKWDVHKRKPGNPTWRARQSWPSLVEDILHSKIYIVVVYRHIDAHMSYPNTVHSLHFWDVPGMLDIPPVFHRICGSKHNLCRWITLYDMIDHLYTYIIIYTYTHVYIYHTENIPLLWGKGQWHPPSSNGNYSHASCHTAW